ncbi:hypothetical protein ANCDUO_12088 [Ancylostoma duodenale]|uniref:Uncharacterized protein n=1 Tax=Ancylostoma duodenale TaxID=51022 RepID=A0A0C2D6H0_9BILA|nr:hypothetical protein ANCDUO_12088 [Ancylostoma duodenale]
MSRATKKGQLVRMICRLSRNPPDHFSERQRPMVFTVLQPTVIPIPPPPPAPPRRSAAGVLIRGLLLFLLFVACFTAGLVLIYGVDTVYTGIFGVFKADEAQPTTTAAPEQLGLVNPMGMSQKSEEKGPDDEVKIFLNSVPVAKVMVIEGGNNAEGKDLQMKENERPIHPYEAQEAPLEAFNRPVMNIPPPLLALQARQMAYAQAVRQWRMRRLQQAIYEQQMLREAMMRAEWMEHQRRAALEDELARSIAQARWEQTQRAKAAEEYQAEMQRAQWAQAQRAMWERAQMAQQMQQMHHMHHQMYWQHPWWQPQWVNNQQPQQQPQAVEASTENIFKAVESQKPEDSIFKIVEEQKPEVIVPEEQKPEITVVEEPKPEMNVFKPVEQPKSEEIHVPDPDEDEGPAGPVVVEDRFPRIEDRTTVPVEGTTAAAPEQGSDEDMEHDPLAAFLRYFEQEAQKINEARAKPAVVDSEVHKQDMPPAVDEPEPHFEEFQRPQQVPRLVVD